MSENSFGISESHGGASVEQKAQAEGPAQVQRAVEEVLGPAAAALRVLTTTEATRRFWRRTS
jgi:hypothetical protein